MARAKITLADAQNKELPDGPGYTVTRVEVFELEEGGHVVGTYADVGVRELHLTFVEEHKETKVYESLDVAIFDAARMAEQRGVMLVRPEDDVWGCEGTALEWLLGQFGDES